MNSWLRLLFEAFFPFSCHSCRASTGFGQVICERCLSDLQKALRPPFRITDIASEVPIWSLGFYEGVFSESIKVIKYRPSKKLFSQIVPSLKKVFQEKKIAPALPDIDVLIPVPLHAEREKHRGFNQAQLIANLFSDILKTNVSKALTRVRATLPQADCNEEERQRNLAGAFSLADGLMPHAFRGKTLAIVDDVATTGVTIQSCSEILQKLSPRLIIGLTLAHAPRYFPPS